MVSKDGDENMLRREVFQEMRILDQIIQNTTVHHDGEDFKYTDICARWDDECFSNDILNLDYIMDEVNKENRYLVLKQLELNVNSFNLIR